jgi:DNA adenine methylase
MKESRKTIIPVVKSPLNYIGGKYKILEQILPIFPQNIRIFVDLFAGGANVGSNVNAEKVIFNDNLSYLIDMFREMTNKNIGLTISYIKKKIAQLNLTKENEKGYKLLRDNYNLKRYPLDLFILIAFSFNHQIRFNNRHEFNCPFGKNRSSYNQNMENNLISFINKIQSMQTEFLSLCFNDFCFDNLMPCDFVYCDPPYLITTGSYNDGKRGFKGWGTNEENNLLFLLDKLENANIKFALSNVIEHKGMTNTILKRWLAKRSYNIHYINKNYSNANYRTKKCANHVTKEILITNY